MESDPRSLSHRVANCELRSYSTQSILTVLISGHRFETWEISHEIIGLTQHPPVPKTGNAHHFGLGKDSLFYLSHQTSISYPHSNYRPEPLGYLGS